MNSLRLTQLAENVIKDREMHQLSGGNNCICACKSTSTTDNGAANNLQKSNSPSPDSLSTSFQVPKIDKPQQDTISIH